MNMKYKISFLPSADEDLLGIRDYLCQFYPNTATNFFAKYDKLLALLRKNPHVCMKYPYKPQYHRGIAGKYLVFYVIDEKDKTVEIHRVLRASSDISQLL